VEQIFNCHLVFIVNEIFKELNYFSARTSMLRSTYFLLIILPVLLWIPSVHAQLSLRIGESFLQGRAIKKVTITYDDHTVWALTSDGKVYYKSTTAADFSLYPQTINEMVDDLSGYGEQEIYFSVKPKKLIQVKNGVKTILPLIDPEITTINGITVMLDGMKQLQTSQAHFAMDRLAIATNKYLYMVLRDENNITQYDIYNQPNFDVKGFNITKSGIKGVEFRGNFSINDRCGWPTGQSIAQQIRQAVYVAGVPQHATYGDINCSLFNYDPGDPISVNDIYQYWGTNSGLYIRSWGNCDNSFPIRNPINNQSVNAIEELHFLAAVSELKFVIAASDNGLYYTKAPVRDGVKQTDVDDIGFTRLSGLSENVIKNFAIDYKNYAAPGTRPLYDPASICEKEIWLATEDGIRKIYPELDGTTYQERILTTFRYNRAPDTDLNNELTFNLCGNESVEINSNLTIGMMGTVLIQWTKDGIEIPQWTGQRTVELSEEGSYRAELFMQCEGIRMRSQTFTIEAQALPQITFNYPVEIELCEGGSKELSTVEQAGYVYKWFKDDTEIQNATDHNFTADAQGSYHVEVSNCAGNFIASNKVNIRIEIIQTPVIAGNKPSYCFGETASLRIDNTLIYKTHWYKNGVEIMAFLNKDEIIATEDGSYEVMVENANGCHKSSTLYNLQMHPFPVVSVTKNPANSLCYGASASLSTQIIAGAQYKWNTGATTSSITVTESGDYFVEVTSEFGCATTSDQVSLSINDQIILPQPLQSKICTISGDQLILRAEPGYLYYTWNGSKGSDNTLTISKSGDYQLTVEDQNGCQAKVLYKVIPWCKEISIPNAFSPNGDGANDVWLVAGLEDDTKASITIYNRYGVLIFQSQGSKPSWDGRYRGADVQSGVYYYVIQSSSTAKPLKGSLTVLR